MLPLTRGQSDTLAALREFGVIPVPDSVRASGAGILFAFAHPRNARQILGDRTLFGQGRLGILHSRVVGGVVTEYRSYRTGDQQSLHVVIGKRGDAFADLDRFNPYQGPASLFLHGALELAPHLARRLALLFIAKTTLSRWRNGRARPDPGGSLAAACPGNQTGTITSGLRE